MGLNGAPHLNSGAWPWSISCWVVFERAILRGTSIGWPLPLSRGTFTSSPLAAVFRRHEQLAIAISLGVFPLGNFWQHSQQGFEVVGDA